MITFGLRAVECFVPSQTKFRYDVLSAWEYFFEKELILCLLVKEMSLYQNCTSFPKTKNFCVIHIQSNTTIFHLVVQ